MLALKNWPSELQAKFIHIVELVEQHGPQDIGMPLIKSIGNGIFEIRVKSKDNIGRAIFCMVKHKEIIILHGFIKKTQKIPLKDLKIAKMRLKEIQNEKKSNF